MQNEDKTIAKNVSLHESLKVIIDNFDQNQPIPLKIKSYLEVLALNNIELNKTDIKIIKGIKKNKKLKDGGKFGFVAGVFGLVIIGGISGLIGGIIGAITLVIITHSLLGYGFYWGLEAWFGLILGLIFGIVSGVLGGIETKNTRLKKLYKKYKSRIDSVINNSNSLNELEYT